MLLATGRVRPPVLGPDFPAQPLTCRLTWDELVLPPPTAAALADVDAWLRHHHALHQRYELSGAAILNVVQLATLRALARLSHDTAQPADPALVPVQLADLLDGIRLEGQKEGRLL